MLQTNQLMVILIIYVLILMILGFYQGRKVKNDSDYAIAGRSLPGWLAALSERAAGESSWALLGLPGFVYTTGLAGIWPAIGCVIGIITAWSLIAWRLRDESEKYNLKTFTGFIAKKHGMNEKGIRFISSFTIVFFFFFYSSAQFIGGGIILHFLFGFTEIQGIIITALVIIPYTVYGGYRSIAYTGGFQAVVMLLTLLLTPVCGIIYMISTNDHLFAYSITEALNRAGGEYCSLTKLTTGFTAGAIIGSGLSWAFGYLGGLPQLSLRFMSIKDKRNAKIGRNVGVIYTLLVYISAIAIGWLGIAFFGPDIILDPEYVMPEVLMKVFPSFLAGIFIIGIVAAMLSTASSILVLSASELSENIIKKVIKRKYINEKNSLLVSRITTILLSIFALFFAVYLSQKLIFTLVSYVWAGIGGTYSVVILLSLFWKKYHGRAVYVTIIYGLLFTITWIATGMEKIITAKLMTFVTTMGVAIIASLIIPEGKKINKCKS